MFWVRWGKLKGCGHGIMMYCWYIALFCVLCVSSKNRIVVLRGKLWIIESNVVWKGLELGKLDPSLSWDRPSEIAMEGWATSMQPGDNLRDGGPFPRAVAASVNTFPLISYSIYFWKTQKVQSRTQGNSTLGLPPWSPGWLGDQTDSEFAITVWNRTDSE